MITRAAQTYRALDVPFKLVEQLVNGGLGVSFRVRAGAR
jgi:hypothetical protein